MIKFRYKRKETANNAGNSSSTKSKDKSVEIKSSDSKDDMKPNSLKCEANDTKAASQQEYMEDCIRAIVVSVEQVARLIFD